MKDCCQEWKPNAIWKRTTQRPNHSTQKIYCHYAEGRLLIFWEAFGWTPEAKIVKEVFHSSTDITLNGKKVEAEFTVEAWGSPLCYKCAILWPCTNNAAKQNTHYMSTTVKISWPKVSIQQGIARLQELNEMSSHYLSLKSVEGSPHIPSNDGQAHSEFEMCTLVLSMLLSSIVCAF